MSNIVAIAVSLQLCMNGPIVLNACEDGSQPFLGTINIMNGSSSEDCMFSWNEIRKCVNKWDSILEIKKDDRILFILFPDGTLKHDDKFKVDQAALIFYQGIAELLNQKVLNK